MELDVRDRGPTFEISTNAGMEEMDVNLKDVLPGLFGHAFLAPAQAGKLFVHLVTLLWRP